MNTEEEPQTRAQQLIGDFSPKLVSLTDDVLFGDIWTRPELSPRDRSLITVAALIAGGALGRYIVDGYAQQDTPMVVAGAILVAALAILTDLTFSLLARIATPRTSSANTRGARGSAPSPTSGRNTDG
jgi:ABC-type proline/glycine betaine transport systems, permease component